MLAPVAATRATHIPGAADIDRECRRLPSVCFRIEFQIFFQTEAENYGSKIFKNGRQILIFCDKTAFYGSKFYDLLRKNEKHFLSSQIEKNLPSSFDFL